MLHLVCEDDFRDIFVKHVSTIMFQMEFNALKFIYTKLIGMVENLKFIRMIVCASVVKFHFHWQHVAANDVIKVDNFDFMQYAWNAKLEYWRTMRIASHSLWYWIQFVIIVWSNSVSDRINLLARFSKAKQLKWNYNVFAEWFVIGAYRETHSNTNTRWECFQTIDAADNNKHSTHSHTETHNRTRQLSGR